MLKVLQRLAWTKNSKHKTTLTMPIVLQIASLGLVMYLAWLGLQFLTKLRDLENNSKNNLAGLEEGFQIEPQTKIWVDKADLLIRLIEGFRIMPTIGKTTANLISMRIKNTPLNGSTEQVPVQMTWTPVAWLPITSMLELPRSDREPLKVWIQAQ